MRLRVLEGIWRTFYFAAPLIDEVVVAFPLKAICPMKASIEPLRAIWGGLLCNKHIPQLVKEGQGVRGGIKIVAFPAPICPSPNEAVKDLASSVFASCALRLWKRG